jgi:hypothetical protein
MAGNELNTEATTARALHRRFSVVGAAVLAAVLAPVGLVRVPGVAGYDLHSPRSAGDSQPRSGTYTAPAGTFRASFHGTPVAQVVGAPDQTFTMVARWVHGPVVSVSYQRFPAKQRSPYWDESAVLVRLDAGDERQALYLLSSKLNWHFVPFAGAEVAPMAFLTTANGRTSNWGDLVVTPGGMYEVLGADEAAPASQSFVASFSTASFPGTQPVPIDGVADVTGYARTSLMSRSSGPVTVEVTGYREAELAGALDTLPSGPAPYCLEDFTDYQVAFMPSPGAPVNYQAVGHGCAMAVVVSEPGRALVPRRDKGCALFDAVAAVLPAAASGTLSGEPECKAPAKLPDGTVEGQLVREGGRSPGSPVPLPGVVVLSAIGQDVSYPVDAGADGAFRASVPPGTYLLTGTSPKVHSDDKEMQCLAARPVALRPGSTTRGVRVVCNVK